MSSSSPTSSLRKKPSLRGRVFSGSRKPISVEPNPGEHPIAVLRIQVIGCKELPAADMNGKSDPYVVLTFARSRQKTPVISKTLTPVYDPKTATFDFPMYASVLEKVGSLVEVVVWDKDVIGKDYLGELALPACDWFKHNGGAKAFTSPANKDFWLPLVSSRAKRDAKGQIHLKLGFTAAPGSPAPDFERVYNEHVTGGRSGRSLMSAPPTEGFGTLGEHAAVDAGNDSDDSEEMAYTPRQRRTSTLGLGLTSVPEHSASTQSKVTRTSSTSMKKLPTFRLNWSGTKIDYSFGAHHDVEGIVLLEVRSAANLPKLAGGVSKLVGGSWDMDPFVIVNFNRKAFRTRVIRHSLEPEWNEKIMFHVRKADLEEGAKITLSVLDWDKFQSNDYVGDATIDLAELMARAPKPDPKTGLFAADDDLAHGLKDMVLPLNVSKDVKTDGVKPSIYVRIKYDPHAFLRQRFWRATLHRSDADNNGSWSRAELSEFLDKNGLSLAPEAVSKFFDVRGKDEITMDEAVESLEQAIGLRLEKGQRPEWAPKAQASPVSPTAPAAPSPAPEPMVQSPVSPAPLLSLREVETAPAECEPEPEPPVEAAAEPAPAESEPVIELVTSEEPAPKPEEAPVEPEPKPEPEPQSEVETAPAEPAPAAPAPVEPEPTTERAVEPEPEHARAPEEAPAPTEPATPAPAVVSEPEPQPQPPVEAPAPVVPEPAPQQDTTTTPATPDEFVMVPKDEPEDLKLEAAAPDVKPEVCAADAPEPPVVEPTPEPEPEPAPQPRAAPAEVVVLPPAPAPVVELATPAPAPKPEPPVEVVAPAPPPPVEIKKEVPAPVEVKEKEVPAPVVDVKKKEVPAPVEVKEKEAPPATVGYKIEEDVVAPAPVVAVPEPPCPPPKAEPASVVKERAAPAPAPSRETKKEKSLPGHYEPNGHAANGHAVTKPAATKQPTNTRADEMNKHGQGKGKTKTKAPAGGVELSPAQSDLATSYAALVLADAGVAVSGANILALASAAGIALEPFWAEIFARGLEGQDVKSILLNVGVGSGAPAASAAPAAGAAVVCEAEPEKDKEEEKVESEDEGFGGLFD